MKQRKTRAVAEFGDFQTPRPLAQAVVYILAKSGIRPCSILEPTCGSGAFIQAAATAFPNAATIIGLDINLDHIKFARKCAENDRRIKLLHSDFFGTKWESIFEHGRSPWLIIGNPPWVTSAELGAIDSHNLPDKENFHGRSGIEAITGKSNFDISEWMILRYLDWLQGREGVLAVLCKTAVARKILLSAWKRAQPIKNSRIYKFDAIEHFGAAVDACLFIIEKAVDRRPRMSCDIFDSLDASKAASTLTYHEGHLISDAKKFERQRSLFGPEERYIWRSGIKHDCSKIMEMKPTLEGYVNGFGEKVSIEPRFLYPMLKSSDVGNGRLDRRSFMLVTQRRVGEDTSHIKREAPETWDYLQKHSHFFSARRSSIYRNKPQFSIFGVGPYSFAPWKIAISGFYKKLHFLCVGPVNEQPFVFDDTVYFLPCESENEARFLQELLTSEEATEFFHSMISWDEKRPITVDLLRRLNLSKLAGDRDCKADYIHFTARHRPLFAQVDCA